MARCLKLALLSLLAAGCAGRVDYAEIRPKVGQAAFAVGRHVPLLEAPARVTVYRPAADVLISHFDTAQPETIITRLGPAGQVIQDSSYMRGAFGF